MGLAWTDLVALSTASTRYGRRSMTDGQSTTNAPLFDLTVAPSPPDAAKRGVQLIAGQLQLTK
jgi:hypothetical protein